MFWHSKAFKIITQDMQENSQYWRITGYRAINEATGNSVWIANGSRHYTPYVDYVVKKFTILDRLKFGSHLTQLKLNKRKINYNKRVCAK